MLPTEAALVMYYLGLGYLIFLGWAGVMVDVTLGATLSRPAARRLARGMSVVGVVHPALALAGVDVARQLQRQTEADTDDTATAQLAYVCLAVATALAAIVIVVMSRGTIL